MTTYKGCLAVVVLMVASFFCMSCSDDGGGMLERDAATDAPLNRDAQEDTGVDAPPPLAPPTLTPAEGTYPCTTTIVMTSVAGTKIYFTVNERSPVSNGKIATAYATEYTKPYTFEPLETDSVYVVRAVSVTMQEPLRISTEVAASIVISAASHAQAPVFFPAPGTYVGSVGVVVQPAGSSGDTVRYTIDGTAPTRTVGTIFTGDPIVLTQTTSVKAVAYSTAFLASPVAEGWYTVLPATNPPAVPTFTPPAGSYQGSVSVTLASATPSTTLCYTTSGIDPSGCMNTGCVAGTTQYTAPITFAASSSAYTLKAIACLTGTPSAVATAAYNVSPLKQSQPVYLPSGTVVWGTKPTATAASGATILITKTIDGSTPADPTTTGGSTGAMTTCAPATGVVAATGTVDLSAAAGLPSQGANGLKRHAKYRLRTCVVGDLLSDVASADYDVRLPQPTLWSNATASIAAPAFGVVNQPLAVFFKSEASGVLNTDGAAAEGGLCVGTGGTIPSCASSGLACGSTTNTVWLPASSVRDPEGTVSAVAYAVWDGTGANDYNASERRQFNVVACRPDVLPSLANPGTWSFKLSLAIYLGGSAGLPANPQLTVVNVGVDIASESLNPAVPATSAAPGHVVFGLWNGSTTGTTYAALSAAGALTSSTSAMPSGIAVYYTEDNATPVLPSQCGDATGGPTWKTESSGATPHINFPLTWAQPVGGTPVRAIACAPNWTSSEISSLALTAGP